MNTIIMTEEYWANSELSIARYYGGIAIGKTQGFTQRLKKK